MPKFMSGTCATERKGEQRLTRTDVHCSISFIETHQKVIKKEKTLADGSGYIQYHTKIKNRKF